MHCQYSQGGGVNLYCVFVHDYILCTCVYVLHRVSLVVVQ